MDATVSSNADRITKAESLEEALIDASYAPGIVSTFISNTEFWYVTRDQGSYTYYLVSEDGAPEPLLPARIFRALPDAVSAAISAARGLLPGLVVFPSTLTFWTGGRRWLVNRNDGSLAWMPEASIYQDVIWSPDGTKYVHLDDRGTCVVDIEQHTVRRIDPGAKPGHLGSAPRVCVEETQRSILRIDGMQPAALWSPDSEVIATHFTDERSLSELTLLASCGGDLRDAAVVRKPRIYPGDPDTTKCDLVLIEPMSGTLTPVALPTQLATYESPLNTRATWWGTGQDESLYLILCDRLRRTQNLWRINRTGGAALLITETSATRAEGTQWMYGNETPLWISPSGKRCLWPSQRDGWVALYEYDLDKPSPIGIPSSSRTITFGNMNVRRILHVDEARNNVTLVVEGLVESNPYLRQIVTVDMGGGAMTRITNDELDHDALAPASPEAIFFLDISSRYDTLPQVLARDWRGAELFTLPAFREDRLTGLGWEPPELVENRASNGTGLFGLLYRPSSGSADLPAPLIDYLYPGPQISRVPYSFSYSAPVIEIFGKAATLCRLGFGVLLMDARGTPGRSKEFHDFAFQDPAWAAAAADHRDFVLAVASRDWVDSERIGAIGISGGGFAAVRLLTLHPDVYSFGISISGNHDNVTYHDFWLEEYYGPNPAAWKEATNTLSADLPRGQLLLIHGELDDNVQPTNLLRFASRLIQAGCPIDMLYVPGADHSFTNTRDYVRRHAWRHLLRYAFGMNLPMDGLSTAATHDLLNDWRHCLA